MPALCKWRDPVNPARWRGHLDKLLPSAAEVKKKRNGGTTRSSSGDAIHREVPAFMTEVRALNSVSARWRLNG